MKFLIIIIIFLILIINIGIVFSAVPGTTVGIKYFNGTQLSSQKFFQRSCGGSDIITTGGGSSDMWGIKINWLNLSVLKFEIKYNANVPISGGPYADHLKARLYYEPPIPDIDFQAPTPGDGDTISSMARFRGCADIPMTECKLEENSTGVFLNTTMNIEANPLCCDVTKRGFPNETSFNYSLHGTSGSGWAVTPHRTISVENDKPTIIQNNPLNNSVIAIRQVIINATVTDPDSDKINIVDIYGANNTDNLYESLLYRKKEMFNETHTYNFTSPVIRPDKNTVLLYHLDNRSEFGEDDTVIFDFSRSDNNGYGSSAPFNSTGYIGGARRFSTSRIMVSGFGIDANVTISLWAKSSSSNCAGSSGDALFSDDSVGRNGIKIVGSNCETIRLYGNEISIKNVTVTPPDYNANIWNLYTGVANSSGIHLFLNGKLMGSNPLGTINITSLFAFGCDHTSTGCFDDYFQGHMDEIGIWNRSLSGKEIKDLYRLPDGTYYWNVSASDLSVSSGSELWQFIVNGCDSMSCNVNCNHNLTYPYAEDLLGQILKTYGSGHTIWQNTLLNVGGAELAGECKVDFLGDVDII